MPWRQLTTGVPASLSMPPMARRVARDLARLIGCEAASLGTSTLHVYWDLFEVLAREPICIFIAAGAYPIARWGVERVAAKGIKARFFDSVDLEGLERNLQQACRLGAKPVVVTDGLSPATGKPAPLPGYLALMRKWRGYLVVDDTQGLGVLGQAPNTQMPYGLGGAGTLAWHGIQGPELIVGSSLAKGFGVPIAVLAGSQAFISQFEAESATRTHCSPPAIALIHAARHAVEANRNSGESLRLRLFQRVQRFRARLKAAGLSAWGGFFPVQTLKPVAFIDPFRLHDRLLQSGVRTVLHRPREGKDARIGFLINALHEPWDIDEGVAILQQACVSARSRNRGIEHGSTVFQ